MSQIDPYSPRLYDSDIDGMRRQQRQFRKRGGRKLKTRETELPKVYGRGGETKGPGRGGSSISGSGAAFTGLRFLEVADLDSPTELNSEAGAYAGQSILCYENGYHGSNVDGYTLYAYNTTTGSATSPSRMLASGSGAWEAVAGRHVMGNATFQKPGASGRKVIIDPDLLSTGVSVTATYDSAAVYPAATIVAGSGLANFNGYFSATKAVVGQADTSTSSVYGRQGNLQSIIQATATLAQLMLQGDGTNFVGFSADASNINSWSALMPILGPSAGQFFKMNGGGTRFEFAGLLAGDLPIATSGDLGGVIVPPTGGITVDGSGNIAVALDLTTIGLDGGNQLEVIADSIGPTQIDETAGYTWTGVHSFTGGTITVPTATAGDNDTSAASTAFVTAAVPNSSYRTIFNASASHTAAKVAGTYGMGHGDVAAVTGTGTLYPLAVIRYEAADYPTVNGVTTKLRVRSVLNTNDVAPFTGTFIFGLHPVTRPATSGGAGLVIYTIGAAVAGSTCTHTNPAADSQLEIDSGDFTPPADGYYILGFVTNQTMAASSHVHCNAQLQYRNA